MSRQFIPVCIHHSLYRSDNNRNISNIVNKVPEYSIQASETLSNTKPVMHHSYLNSLNKVDLYCANNGNYNSDGINNKPNTRLQR